MKTKVKILSVILVMMLIANPLFIWTQTTVLAAEQTFTIGDETLYSSLMECFASNEPDNKEALISSSDDTHEITLDMDKVEKINIKNVDMTNTNSKFFLETLFRECANLKTVCLTSCNLDGVDFSELENKNNLTSLFLVECDLKSVPDLQLSKLETLCMSENNLSDAADSFDSLNKNNFPVLTKLWLDKCNITNIDFIENVGNLTDLSLGENKLMDDSLDVLIAASSENLSGLKALNLGATVHRSPNIMINSNTSSSNNFTQVEKLASLPKYFSQMSSLNISGLRIASLEGFEEISDNIVVNLTRNNITDFAGLESKVKFDLNNQNITLYGNFAAGMKSEIPNLVKRILDTEDVLNGTLQYVNCSLSDDGKDIVIEPNKNTAYVQVAGGKLTGSKIDFSLKRVPSYAIPQDLMAQEGDILADVALPNGFAWQDNTLDVGSKGINNFKAIYTPDDTDTYVIVYDINVPITVEGEEPTKPSEPETEPIEPTKPTEPETEPTEPTKPTESETNPIEPTEPTEPETNPTEPTEPTEPTKPETDTTEPAVAPTEPTEPATTLAAPTEPVTGSTEQTGDEQTTAETLGNYDADKDNTEAVETSDTSPILPITVLLFASGIIYMAVSDKKKTV